MANEQRSMQVQPLSETSDADDEHHATYHVVGRTKPYVTLVPTFNQQTREGRSCLVTMLLVGAAVLVFGAAVLAWVFMMRRQTLTIACVGDSLTRGDGASPSESYPSQLGKLLGGSYRVLNLGVDGATALKVADYPYWKTTQFQEALRSSAQIVIIMLGTNDAKPWNWDLSSFQEDYRSMIETFSRQAGAKPQVFLVVPPPVFEKGGYEIDKTTVNSVLPRLIPRIASINGLLSPINVFTSFAIHCSGFDEVCHLMSGVFHNNNIHPNAEGYRIIAETVHHYLRRHGAL